MNEKQMQDGISLLLKGMGVDLLDPNYRDTPKRVAKMYRELFTPTSSRWNSFPASSNDLVLLRGHKAVGICPHHLQPVEFTCHVGYIPNEQTVGLSKLARVIEHQLVRPIMQEDLAHKVAMSLEEQLHPKGIGVVIAGVHGCMRFRGVRTDGDVVTSVMKGILLLNPAARMEFLQIIGNV